MLNAKTCKNHLLNFFKDKGSTATAEEIVNHHFSACSTNYEETAKFGIKEHVF
jgi:hypothetical protein